ncbi:NUDIX domain-containing protein [Patescibacteria group bacterium]|nr:NUDIX domain-containing protein [Patescibacteria group bacterium]MBU1921628.1 NUDIX domain-containing protein [Patescibacteria group bacterium]
MIECVSIKGNKVKIPKEKLVFRPSVYGIIINNGKILMTTVRSNGKLFFPGGGVNIGERLEDALKRETKEETGIEIRVEKFLHFKEQFCYWDPGDEVYQMLNFFYICKPLTTDLIEDDEVDDEEAMSPEWIDIEEVEQRKDNLEAVEEVFQLL